MNLDFILLQQHRPNCIRAHFHFTLNFAIFFFLRIKRVISMLIRKFSRWIRSTQLLHQHCSPPHRNRFQQFCVALLFLNQYSITHFYSRMSDSKSFPRSHLQWSGINCVVLPSKDFFLQKYVTFLVV